MTIKVGATAMMVGVAAVAALGLLAWSKGGLANLVKSAAGGAVDAAGGAVSGAVGAVSGAVGIPTPDKTTTDPGVARWLIDRVGWFEASLWCGAPAMFIATTMPAGSGTPPAPGTPIAARFGLTSGYIDFGTGAGW